MRHSVPVSTRSSDLNSTAAPVRSNVAANLVANASDARMDGKTPRRRSTEAPSEPIFEPNEHSHLSPEELARERLRVERNEYLLYAEKPLVLSARLRVTVWVRAPHGVTARGEDCLVDRLPPQLGRDSQPLAELNAVCAGDRQ